MVFQCECDIFSSFGDFVRTISRFLTIFKVILAGTIESPHPVLQSRQHLFGSLPASVRYGKNWGELYKPRLVRNLADGKIYVDTKFSRLIGMLRRRGGPEAKA